MRPRTDKKLEILQAGSEVMHRKGYHGTGVQQIVDAAGVPKGSFYNYFKSKEEFVIAAMEFTGRPAIVQFEKALQDPSMAPNQRILAAFQNQIQAFEKEKTFTKGCFVGNMCQEVADTQPAVAEKAEYMFRAYSATLAQCLRQAQKEGRISADYDPDQLAEFIFNSWEGAVLRMKSSRNAQPLHAFLNILNEVLSR